MYARIVSADYALSPYGKYHIITNSDGELVDAYLYVEDSPNKGIPPSFFRPGYVFFTLSTGPESVLQWQPSIGPAPIWTKILTTRNPLLAITPDVWKEFKEWYSEIY